MFNLDIFQQNKYSKKAQNLGGKQNFNNKKTKKPKG